MSSKPVKCARDAMAYPPDCFSLPTDGRKSKHVCRQRRELFIQYALYADGDGTRGYPGEARLCRELKMTRRTLERRTAELKELGCVIEALSPDGKIKLHGPRGTTERLVVPRALPLPGSTAWEQFPEGARRLVNTGFGCTFGKDGKIILFGEPLVAPLTKAVAPNSVDVGSPVAPLTTPVAPLSAAVAPDTIAVAPKPADFGGQPPLLPTQTATTTATTQSKSVEEVGGVRQLQQAYRRETGKFLTVVPVAELVAAMLKGYSAGTINRSVEKWASARTLPAEKLRNPVKFLLDELPYFLAENTEEALAAAEVAFKAATTERVLTPEECAQARADFLAEYGLTEEEFEALGKEEVTET